MYRNPSSSLNFSYRDSRDEPIEWYPIITISQLSLKHTRWRHLVLDKDKQCCLRRQKDPLSNCVDEWCDCHVFWNKESILSTSLSPNTFAFPLAEYCSWGPSRRWSTLFDESHVYYTGIRFGQRVLIRWDSSFLCSIDGIDDRILIPRGWSFLYCDIELVLAIANEILKSSANWYSIISFLFKYE